MPTTREIGSSTMTLAYDDSAATYPTGTQGQVGTTTKASSLFADSGVAWITSIDVKAALVTSNETITIKNAAGTVLAAVAWGTADGIGTRIWEGPPGGMQCDGGFTAQVTAVGATAGQVFVRFAHDTMAVTGLPAIYT